MKHINVFHRIAAVLLCLCMLLPLSACGETKMYQKQVFAMDTVMTLTAYGNKAEAGDEHDLRHQPCRGCKRLRLRSGSQDAQHRADRV